MSSLWLSSREMTFAGITQRVVREFDSRWRQIFFCSSPTLQSTTSLLLQSKEDWDNLVLLSTSCPYKFRVVSAWLFSSSFPFLQVEYHWSGSSMRCISTHEIETISNECLTVLLRARTGNNKQIKTVCSIAFLLHGLLHRPRITYEWRSWKVDGSCTDLSSRKH